ncbi:hypothetical protein [Phormidium nigroviride]
MIVIAIAPKTNLNKTDALRAKNQSLRLLHYFRTTTPKPLTRAIAT